MPSKRPPRMKLYEHSPATVPAPTPVVVISPDELDRKVQAAVDQAFARFDPARQAAYTPAEFKDKYGLGENEVYRMIEDGELGCIRKGTGNRYIVILAEHEADWKAKLLSQKEKVA